ncbi:MAG: ABC transporter substrate-binding protein, partial [Clostridia bacterium]|nr:ABC transporter substrate-binding protein [Clostridia bacterium]
MKKIVSLILTLTLILGALTACSNNASSSNSDTSSKSEPVAVRVLALKGPTGIGMAKMMDDSSKSEGSKYTFTIAGQPTEAVSAVAGGKVDIAAVPTNLAATLYQRTEKGVKMLAVNTLGSLYILEKGNTINSIKDLRGKTIYATGQGANPEYVLNFLLSKNGLTPGKDVTVEFKAEHSELAALMAAGECVLGMLPEPNVSSAMAQNSELRIALNLNDEWNKVADSDSRLAMGCVIVNESFLKAHPTEVENFMNELESSIKYASENPKDAGTL